MHMPDECCTQPSEALVMMKTLPAAIACKRIWCTTFSSCASWSRTCTGMAPYCRCTASRCVVHSRVSSQSKMVTTCACFGRLSCGIDALDCSSFLMYAARIESLVRGGATVLTTTGSAAPPSESTLSWGSTLGSSAKGLAARGPPPPRAPSVTPTRCMNLSRQLSPIVDGGSALNTAPSTALNTAGSSGLAAFASGGESTEAALMAAHSDAAASPEAEELASSICCKD